MGLAGQRGHERSRAEPTSVSRTPTAPGAPLTSAESARSRFGQASCYSSGRRNSGEKSHGPALAPPPALLALGGGDPEEWCTALGLGFEAVQRGIHGLSRACLAKRTLAYTWPRPRTGHGARGFTSHHSPLRRVASYPPFAKEGSKAESVRLQTRGRK